MLINETIAAGMIVIARISQVYRLRPTWSSTRWPKNQKNTSVRTTQIDVGGLGIGQVTIRQTSPLAHRLDRNISLSTKFLGDRVGEHRGDAEEHQQRRGGDVERADAEPAVALAALGEGELVAPWHERPGYTKPGPVGGDRVVSSDSMVTRPPAGTIPDTPGSYQFKDALGRVIYVGKASSLRQRLSNYFQDPRNLHPRTAQMVATAESVEWIEVRNEVEALMLEWTLIKQHRPRFNIRLRDDKSYPFLAVTVDEQFPRALVMRGRKRKGTRYFGPYAHAYAIRDTLDLLLRSFPIRTCSPGKYNEHHRLGRPCLLFHIEKCCGPCVGEIERARLPRAGQRAVRLPRRRHRRDRPPAERRHARRGQRPRVRAGGADPRSPAGRAAGDREAADGRRAQRGHRRHRHRRRRAGSGRPGVLRPSRPGGRAQGLRARQGRGRQPRRPGRPDHGGAVRRRAAARRAQAGARPRRVRRRRHVRGVADPPARQPGAGARARSAATSGRCTRR